MPREDLSLAPSQCARFPLDQASSQVMMVERRACGVWLAEGRNLEFCIQNVIADVIDHRSIPSYACWPPRSPCKRSKILAVHPLKRRHGSSIRFLRHYIDLWCVSFLWISVACSQSTETTCRAKPLQYRVESIQRQQRIQGISLWRHYKGNPQKGYFIH